MSKESYFLDFIQDKTDHVLHLPVHPKILEILNKRGFQFPPKYDEDSYNKLVKQFVETLELPKCVTEELKKEKKSLC